MMNSFWLNLSLRFLLLLLMPSRTTNFSTGVEDESDEVSKRLLKKTDLEEIPDHVTCAGRNVDFPWNFVVYGFKWEATFTFCAPGQTRYLELAKKSAYDALDIKAEAYKERLEIMENHMGGIRLKKVTLADMGTYAIVIKLIHISSGAEMKKMEDICELSILSLTTECMNIWTATVYTKNDMPYKHPSGIVNRVTCKTKCEEDPDCVGMEWEGPPVAVVRNADKMCFLLYSVSRTLFKDAQFRRSVNSNVQRYEYMRCKQASSSQAACQSWTEKTDTLTGKSSSAYIARVYGFAMSVTECKRHCVMSEDCIGIDFYYKTSASFNTRCFVLMKATGDVISYIEPTPEQAQRFIYTACAAIPVILGKCLNPTPGLTDDEVLKVMRGEEELIDGLSVIRYGDAINVSFSLPVDKIPEFSSFMVVLEIQQSKKFVNDLMASCIQSLQCHFSIEAGQLPNYIKSIGFFVEQKFQNLYIVARVSQLLFVDHSKVTNMGSELDAHMYDEQQTLSTMPVSSLVFRRSFRLLNLRFEDTGDVTAGSSNQGDDRKWWMMILFRMFLVYFVNRK